MGTAGNDCRLAALVVTRSNRLRATATVLFKRPVTLTGPVRNADGGRRHHTQYRRLVFDQGDIDRKLTVAFDELLGAIQGIDQPEALPIGAIFVGRFCRLFGQHWHIRGKGF